MSITLRPWPEAGRSYVHNTVFDFQLTVKACDVARAIIGKPVGFAGERNVVERLAAAARNPAHLGP